jgi:hypothetical protein
MTHQAEDCAMERLKNMSPLDSLWEMAEELGGKKDCIVEDHKAVERKCSKMSEPELEADLEPSGPSEEASSNKSTMEYGINTGLCKEVKTESLWSGN